MLAEAPHAAEHRHRRRRRRDPAARRLGRGDRARSACAPLIMFLIIFLWTPPHFWALAILKKDEYARAGVPMLPAVATERETAVQILVYTRAPGRRVADPGRSPALLGVLYAVAAIALGGRFILLAAPPAAHALAAGRARDVPVLAALPGAAVRRHGRRPRHRRYLIVRSRSDSTNDFGWAPRGRPGAARGRARAPRAGPRSGPPRGRSPAAAMMP